MNIQESLLAAVEQIMQVFSGVEAGEPVDRDAIGEAISALMTVLDEPQTDQERLEDEFDSVEYDGSGRCIVWVKDESGREFAQRYRSIHDAVRHKYANPEPTISGVWCGLKVRPPADDENWLVYDRHVLGVAMLTGGAWVQHKIWIDPETKRIEWQDRPGGFSGHFTKSIGPGWYHISSGVQDLGAKIWNMKWSYARADRIDRIREYSGTAPADLALWPMEYKRAYRETH